MKQLFDFLFLDTVGALGGEPEFKNNERN